jgi:hypothetical protein
MLLPRANERPRALVVHEGGTGAGEGEPTARALGAAAHRPRPWGAAPFAHGRAQADKRAETAFADCMAGPGADRAALGEEQLEQAPHLAIVGG